MDNHNLQQRHIQGITSICGMLICSSLLKINNNKCIKHKIIDLWQHMDASTYSKHFTNIRCISKFTTTVKYSDFDST